MDSLEGRLLIASPQLPDTTFVRSIILMIQHGDNGAFGLVLNRPSEMRLADLWQKIDELPCDAEGFVSVGGPVDGPILVLHTDPTHAEGEIIPDVFIASERDNVRHIVRMNVEPFRLFSGYSGWGAGQLETEMDLGGWLTLPATTEIIFEENVSDLWQNVIHLTGEEFLKGTLGITHFPRDPGLN